MFFQNSSSDGVKRRHIVDTATQKNAGEYPTSSPLRAKSRRNNALTKNGQHARRGRSSRSDEVGRRPAPTRRQVHDQVTLIDAFRPWALLCACHTMSHHRLLATNMVANYRRENVTEEMT